MRHIDAEILALCIIVLHEGNGSSRNKFSFHFIASMYIGMCVYSSAETGVEAERYGNGNGNGTLYVVKLYSNLTLFFSESVYVANI